MRIKIYIAMLITASAFLLTAAEAEDIAAKYVIDDASLTDGTYTAEVYLETNEYLSVGSFGFAFDEKLSAEFTLDTDNFTLFRNLNDVTGEATDINIVDSEYGTANCRVFEWYANDTASGNGTGDGVTGDDGTGDGDTGDDGMARVHLGTITVTGVSEGNGIPRGWKKTSIRLLDWSETTMSKTDFFATPLEDGGICLNDEIWRFLTDEEKKTATDTSITGYYQGLAVDDSANTREWIDIGYTADLYYAEPAPGQTVMCEVLSYNPNNPVTFALYKIGEGEDESDIGENEPDYIDETKEYTPYGLNGRVVCDSEVEGVEDGEYILKISKDTHLTYETKITVETETVELDGVTLLCGDVTGDNLIKQDDRVKLISRLHTRVDAENEKSDLDGDGIITFNDLNILKRDFNKSY